MWPIAYDNHVNRPKLLFSIKSLTISKNSKQEWIISIAFDQKNSGNYDAVYNVERCNVLFPILQKNPISIVYDKGFSLKQRDTRIDTIKIPLPFEIEPDIPEVFDSLQYINLSIEEFSTSKKYLSQKDSGDIVYKTGGSTRAESGLMDIRTMNLSNAGVQFIHYKNKDYKNFFTPKTAIVSYQIIDDRICIIYNHLNPTQTFTFMVNPEIGDKVYLKNSIKFEGSVEDSTKEGKVYRNYQLIYSDISSSKNFLILSSIYLNSE